MAETFKFELVSPERLLVSEEVEAVVIPGVEGEFTAMANHSPLMTTVKPGVVSVRFGGGREERYVVFGGFADVVPERCTLLAESASHVDQVDRDEISRRIREAREELENVSEDEHRTRLEQMLGHLATLEDAV